jgi:hypothetical protein
MPSDSVVALREARKVEQELNGPLIYTPENAAFAHDPPYKVYIYNLGPIEHKVERGSAGTFILKACEPGEPYALAWTLPSVWRDSYFVEQEMKTHSVSGEFMAQDIVNPITAGGKTWWSFGADLSVLGVFWSKNNPPTDAEIAAARSKMESTYRKMLGMAASIEAAGKIDDITPLMRIAASYFGEDRAWNKIYKKTSECPGCGEPAKAGIIRHPCGYIFDPDRALAAGMISEELHKQMIGTRMKEASKPVKKTK